MKLAKNFDQLPLSRQNKNSIDNIIITIIIE